MTREQARRLNKPPGFALRIDAHEGAVVYLADYRTAKLTTTEYPGSAEYFERVVDADEMARRLTHVTGQRWAVTTVPADNTGELWRACWSDTLTADDAFREAFATAFGDDAEDETGEFVRTAFGSFRMRK